MGTETRDLTLKTPYGKFNLRVGCFVFRDGKVLLQRTSKSTEGYWIVVGGRVAFGGTSEETAIREVQEELCCDVESLELAGVMENFFSLNGDDFHEICTYYRVELPSGFVIPTHEMNGDEILLEWHDIDALEGKDLRPSFLKKDMHKFQRGFQHIVVKDS